jgi:CRISPR/Cas system CSM-associated protein Csm3 (group 7 of RAMP superfamily)
VTKRDHIIERWVAEGEWIARSALHTGGDPTGSTVDMALLRSASGEFLIPGASLAGAARNYLARLTATEAEYRAGGESPVLAALFGAPMAGSQPAYASLLVSADAPAVGVNSAVVRENNKIEPESGIAADEAKFNLEVLPAGARFRVRLGLTIYQELPGKVDRAAVLSYFRALLEGFQRGEIRLGARTRKGFGEGAVAQWDLRRMDMSNRAHVVAWLRQSPKQVEPAMALAELGELPQDHREWLEIEASYRLRTSMLIRSNSEEPAMPDSAHLVEGGRAILSGTSVSGVLRQRVERIAKTMKLPGLPGTVMFGPRPNGRQDRRNDLKAGRLWVSEGTLDHVKQPVQSRVALDRFTGGALETALFDEAPCYPEKGEAANASIRLRLELRGGEEDEVLPALLLQAFKDLWLGDLPIGGETGGGRGVLEGLSARIERTGWPVVTLERKGATEVAVTGWNEDWERMAGVRA